MQYQKTDEGGYIIKIERDEQVIDILTTFCKEHDIQNASLSGIGAVDWISCGYYDLELKKYFFTEYNGMHEVVTATGNVMLKEGVPFVHLHALFSDTKNQTFGGHVESMKVGVVLEMILTPLSSRVERRKDDDIGLYLMEM